MKKVTISLILALVMSLVFLTGCGRQVESEPLAGTELATGGTLVLRVNPEIAVEYDETGLVTKVTARNEDAQAIVGACGELVGQETRSAVSELVTAIGNAGFFVEELEGGTRRIVIEIEPGSALPSDTFLDGVIADVKTVVDGNQWLAPLDLEGSTDYGVTDYGVTDYGVTDYGVTDYGVTDYGATDYGMTDYGTAPTARPTPVSTPYAGDSPYDGNTDYAGDSLYDGNTDYAGDSLYDGNTDYAGDTPYDGNTDYAGDTLYDGNTDYAGDSPYDGNSDYAGDSPYDGNTDYDGDSLYD